MSDNPQGNSSKREMPQVQWDDSQMSTSYANVVNAVSSREEFMLFFGTNQTWNARDKEFHVRLSDRIILNPHAAKRLLTLLAGVMREYEARFGRVNIDLASGTSTSGPGAGTTPISAPEKIRHDS